MKKSVEADLPNAAVYSLHPGSVDPGWRWDRKHKRGWIAYIRLSSGMAAYAHPLAIIKKRPAHGSDRTYWSKYKFYSSEARSSSPVLGER